MNRLIELIEKDDAEIESYLENVKLEHFKADLKNLVELYNVHKTTVEETRVLFNKIKELL
jgi:hypothetical protein